MTSIPDPSSFLTCPTPEAWLDNAVDNIDLLLIDHAHCEKKAASMAVKLMSRYSERIDLVRHMARLAREELRHFEQVLSLMRLKNIRYRALEPSRYAVSLHKHVRSGEMERLLDLLIVGAFIEARSCERFEKLAPRLEPDLARFYSGLHEAERRHYEGYLGLAAAVGTEPLAERIAVFARIETDLVLRKDSQFRFHSGPIED